MFVHTSGIQNITNLVISTESFIYYNTTYDVIILYYYTLFLYDYFFKIVSLLSRSKTSRSYKDNNNISYHCPSYIYFSYLYTEKEIYLYKESLKYGFLLKFLNSIT